MRVLGLLSKGIDSFADAVSPSWGNKRAAHRATRQMLEATTQRLVGNDYKKRLGERLSRRRSFKQAESTVERDDRYVSQDYSINSLLEEQLEMLQVRSNGLYGENSIAHSAVEARVTYEVGAGIKIKPTVLQSNRISADQSKAINRVITETLRIWSLHGVDKSRTMSLAMAQRLMVREFANNGECFILLGSSPDDQKKIHRSPVDTAMEFISPRRVETPFDKLNDPNVRMGVQYKNKQVVGYWVRRGTPNDDRELISDQNFVFYPRFDNAGRPRMLHIFEPMFAGQARGIPWIVAAMNKILDFDDYQEAEIIAKQVEACFGLVFRIKKQQPADTLMDYAEAAAEESGQEQPLMESISSAFIQRIGEDDEVTTVDPARPGANYAPFLEGSIRMIAASTNIPYEILAKNFHRTTFASGKLAVNDGEMGFCMRRSTIQDCGLKPILTRVIWDRVFEDEADGTIPVRDFVDHVDDYTRHKYQVKHISAIDESKEIDAFAKGVDQGVVSRADFHDRNGNDREEQEDQIKIEQLADVDRRLEVELYEKTQREKMGLTVPEPTPESENEKREPELAGGAA